MKKIVIIALLSLSSVGIAQKKHEVYLFFPLQKQSINTYAGDLAPNPDAKNDIVKPYQPLIGLGYRHRIKDSKFSVAWQTNLNRVEFQSSLITNGPNSYASYRFNYWSNAFLLKYRPIKFLGIEAGLSLDKYTTNKRSGTSYFPFVEGNYRKITKGVPYAVGGFEVSFARFNVFANYQYGLAPIYTLDYSKLISQPVADKSTARVSRISVGASVKIIDSRK